MSEILPDPYEYSTFEREIEQIVHALRRLNVTTYRESYEAWRASSQCAVSHSTYSKVVSRNYRIFRRNAVEKLCRALGISTDNLHSSDDFGRYSKSTYAILPGNYALVRPTFDMWDTIGRYPMVVSWDESLKCYTIKGSAADADVVFAKISIPTTGQYYEILNSDSGYHSLIIVTMMNSHGFMYGQILTLGEEKGRPDRFRPICAPVVIMSTKEHSNSLPEVIDKSHSEYQFLFGHLKKVYQQQYADIISFFNDEQ